MIGVVTMYNLSLAQNPEVSTDQLREQIRQTVRQATADARQAAADAKQAAREAQGVTVQTVPPVPPLPPNFPGISINGRQFQGDIPPRAKEVSIAFFVMFAVILVGRPIMRAIGKRIEAGAQPPARIPPEMQAQMQQLIQSVDAIAIEVERISEGQRFTAKMLAEKNSRV
jgi:hypothetical protein